ncbi:MAG TPA: hypothetical protein VF332_13690 [Vicinamibacterales bacterium]
MVEFVLDGLQAPVYPDLFTFPPLITAAHLRVEKIECGRADASVKEEVVHHAGR